MTLDISEVGAPDLGVVYESVDVVAQTVDDPEALRCIVESMYAFAGDPPAESYESVTRVTIGIGRSHDADTDALRAFDYVIGAHMGEVSFCQRKAAEAVEGSLVTTIEVANDGLARTVEPAKTNLPAPVIECIVAAAKRWKFPPSVAGRTMTYEFALPVPGVPEAKQ